MQGGGKVNPTPPPGRPIKSDAPASSWLQIRITKRRKAAYVRAAHPAKLTEWAQAHLDRAANFSDGK